MPPEAAAAAEEPIRSVSQDLEAAWDEVESDEEDS